MELIHYSGEPLYARLCFTEYAVQQCRTAQQNALLVDKDRVALVTPSGAAQYALRGECVFQEQDTVSITKGGMLRLLFPYAERSQTLIVTGKCNSNCIMCPYSASYRRHAKAPTEDALRQQLCYLPPHTAHLTVTGGEPTLHTEAFFRIMQSIREKMPSVQCLILSNGRSFALESMCRRAETSFPPDTTAAIPLHAANAALHDAITQTPGSFAQTLTGIQHLLERRIEVELRIVVFRQNLAEMTDLAALIASRFPRVQVVNFMAVELCGSAAASREDVWVSYRTAFQSCTAAIDLLIRSGIDVGIYNFPLCCIPPTYWGLYRRSISGYKIRYSEVCSDCRERAACGGVFASSLASAEADLCPIKGGF